MPALQDGWKSASSDPAQIAVWEREFSECNWAVATGLSGLFVIDVDPEGLETWERMQHDNSDLRKAVEPAFTVRTPRGGLHIYWRGRGPSTASRIAAGIDTRGGIETDTGDIKSGGYILLPGSRTSAGVYSEIGGSLEPLPPVVSGIVPTRKQGETHGLERDPDKDQPRNVQWAVALLEGYAKEGRVSVQGKGGDNTAFQVAASVLDKAISPALAYDLMEEHWNPHCQPPWDDWELERIIRNAGAYGEDTSKGSKGFQSNAEAFEKFVGRDESVRKHGGCKDNLQPWHEYADSVEDTKWLIPRLLPAEGVAIVYGPKGTYKSFFTLDLALCLAYGVSGQWGAPPVKHNVLLFSGEGPKGTGKKRIPAWLEWQNISDRENHGLILNRRVIPYRDSEAWEGVKNTLAERDYVPDLIIIDTLSRLLVGLDENHSKDALMITEFLETLAAHYDCSVLVVHHTGKDENKGARGSSALTANLDTVLSTKRESDGIKIRVHNLKDEDVPEPYCLRMKPIGNSIVLEKVEVLPEAPKPGRSRIDWASTEEITAILNSHGGEMTLAMLTAEIARKYGIDSAVIRRKLNGNKELEWMHTGNLWTLPKQEYDL